MRIARGGLHLRATEQFADHGETFTESQGPGGEGVAKIVSRAFQRFGIRHRYVAGEAPKLDDKIMESQPWPGV